MQPRRRKETFFGILLPPLVLLVLASAALPTPPVPDKGSRVEGQGSANAPSPSTLDPRPLTLDPRPSTLPPTPYAPTELVAAMVELEDPPLAEVYASFKTAPGRFDPAAMEAALPYLERIEQAQDALREQLTRPPLEARVLSSAQRVYNGIAVQVAAGKLDALRKLPGVKAVHVLTPRSRAMDTAGPWVGAPQRWNSGRTGEGVEIAIVDTGVDYTHADLGGSGNPAHFAANDPMRIGDVPGFPGTKVVGGFDFAGDDFDAGGFDLRSQVPVPDPDPMDPAPARTHATALAGIAAGFGVTTAGATFTGPYNATTPVASLAIAPGIAPRARLWAFKVFGRTGPTRADVVIAALERVVDPNGDGNMADHLDVALLPLIGTPFDPTPAPDADAANRSALVGVVPVTPAGNTGDTFFSAVGAAERAITVAASLDNGIALQRLRITQPMRDPPFLLAGAAAFGPPLMGRLAGDVVAAVPPDGRAALTNAADVRGKIAFLTRGNFSAVTQVLNAQEAGAVAALIAGDPTEPALGLIDDGTGTVIRIPAFQLTAADADFFRTTLAAGTRVSLVIEPGDTFPRSELGDTMASFSARGGPLGLFLKPDVTAPGQNLFAPVAGSGAGGGFFSGTCAAAAVTAGAAALILQERPDWTPGQVKTALMNATVDLFLNPAAAPPLYGPARAGAGRLDLTASAGPVTITSMREGAGGSVSFGNIEVVGSAMRAEWLRVVNEGNTPYAAAISYRPATDIPGVAFSAPPSVNVPARGEALLQIVMNADAAQMRHTRDATLDAMVAGAPRHHLSEESGYFLFTPVGGGPVRRVAVYVAARPASSMRAAQNSVRPMGETASFNLDLVGTGVHSGNSFPLDVISLASAFEHQETSPDDAASAGLFNSADIRFLGVRSDFPARGSIANTTLWFAYVAHGPWRSPNELVVNIFIDVNRDGDDDFWLFNFSFANPQTGRSDVFTTAVQDLRTGAFSTQALLNSLSAGQLNTVPFHTNGMVLPVRAAAIGLTDANAGFNYRVTTQIGRLEVDRSQVHFYNAARPGLHFGASTIFFDRPGDRIPVTFNRADFQAAGSSGILVVHFNNRPEESAQDIPVLP